MPSPTYETELDAHLGVLFADIETSGVPYVQAYPGVQGVAVVLRPTLALWRVPFHTQRYLERMMRRDTPPWWIIRPLRTAHGLRQVLLVSLFELAQYCAQWGELPACRRYFRWHMEVIHALMKHGWYDPTTGHTPPADCQLDAIEIVAEGREHLNTLFPGLGDVTTGHRPTTPEGRALWGLVVTDEDGNQHYIPGDELPDNDEEDEDEQY
jgi:hypothetical protein